MCEDQDNNVAYLKSMIHKLLKELSKQQNIDNHEHWYKYGHLVKK